MSCQGCHPTGI
jgi:hypothetical protein